MKDWERALLVLCTLLAALNYVLLLVIVNILEHHWHL